MKVTNNTTQVITLVDGTKLTAYKTVNVAETEQLKKQIDNLVSLGLVRVG